MTAELDWANSDFNAGSLGVGEGAGDVVLEEADDVRQLLDGDVGEDARGVL